MNSGRRGRLLVVSAPSGSGKTTIIERLLKENLRLVRSISATTRLPRAGERNRSHYFFLSQEGFKRGIRRRAFLEYARVLGHLYGTPRAAVERSLKAGWDVILSIDIQGARKIRASGIPVTTLFLVPPSLKVLRDRLRRRGTETAAQIKERLRLARRELAELPQYDYAVVNDHLEEAIASVRAIIQAERQKVRTRKGV